jgi:Xaa-Pro dipeptidase
MSRQQIPGEMAKDGLDALVSFSIENVYYTSGTMLLTQRIIPTRLAASVLYADRTATFIVCGIEEGQVRAESWIKDIRTYVEFQESPLGVLAKVLTEKGLSAGRIGLEMKYLAVAYFRELAVLLPKATFRDGDDLLERVRVIKTKDEIDLLRKGATATDRAIRSAFEAARTGTSEAEMSEAMRTDILQTGADGVAFVVMTTGENSKLVHPTPSNTRIRPGDVVRTDFGGYYGSYFGGYFSDIARTAIAGKPTEKQRATYQRLFEVHDVLLRNVKPGVRACDLYELCRKGFAERGLAFHMPHMGHNIGVFIHEAPMLNPLTTDELRPGMVLAIEPIHREDGFIYHLEDEIVVTESGYELLSPAYDWSKLLTIS